MEKFLILKKSCASPTTATSSGRSFEIDDPNDRLYEESKYFTPF